MESSRGRAAVRVACEGRSEPAGAWESGYGAMSDPVRRRHTADTPGTGGIAQDRFP